MRIIRPAGVRSMLASLVIGLSVQAGMPTPGHAAWTFQDPGFYAETVTTLPPFTAVGVTWAPDGRMFIWTRTGTVRVFKNGVLLPTPFIDISNKVNTYEDRGLLGLAIDPNYASNGYVYLLYTYEEAGDPAGPYAKVSLLTRVTSNPANRDVAVPNSETVMLGSTTTIPCPPPGPAVNCIPSDTLAHTIGSLRFAADGKLFVSNGDAANPSFADPLALRSQDLNSMAGKILRINPDGTAPTDPPNPFSDGTNSVRSKVWAYGLRNPFRFTLHPLTGIPYASDVGWNTWEEFNKVQGGQNFGWPCYEGVGTQSQYQSAFAACRNLSSSQVTPPLYTYIHDAAGGSAPIAGSFYQGNQYPTQYALSWFVADYTARWVRRIVLDGNGNFSSVIPFASNIGTSTGGLVSLELGPDGLLYYVEFTTGVVGRIRHTSGGMPNIPPAAAASAAPKAGYSPLTVSFSSTGSSDPEGLPLSYLWNFGDGTTSASANPVHTYTASGVAKFTVTLTVTDSQNATATATLPVTVGSLPPTATIVSPADQAQVSVGSTINFTGTATDPDDGVLPPSSMLWTVLIHHNTHVHVVGQSTGSSGSFVVEQHDPVGIYAYEVMLTVTDSSGVSDTKSIRLPVLNPGAAPRLLFGFNEGSGTVTADASGNGHNGTLVNGTAWGAGRFGSGALFDGVNDAVSVAAPSTLNFGTADFTIMAWINPASGLGGAQRHIVSKCSGTGWVTGCKELYLNSSDVLTFGSHTTGDTFSVPVPDNTWTHVALVFTSSTKAIQLYTNGVLRTTETKLLEVDGSNHVVTIGNMNGSHAFGGMIDEVQVFGRALSAGEILTTMNTPISPAADTTAPVLSNGQPTGTLAAGTTQTNLGVTTNENATCRYSTSGGVAYATMPNTFGATGGTTHSTPVTGLVNGQSYTYYARCQDGAGNATATDYAITFAIAVPDSTVPTAVMTGPSAGATLTGSVTVSANASDNVGVAGVQFLLDGSNLGSEVTALPYSVTWNTTTASNGTHILSARARDAAGNQATAASISVTVANTAPSGLGAAIGFNEGSGTTAADSSGGGHTATLVNGPTWVAGQYGMGVSFDGVNDSASVANSNTLNLGGGDFTIMAWVRRNALGGSAQRHILAKCATSAWAAGCKELYFAGDQLRFGSATTGDVNSISIADANWHHVAVTFTRSTNTVRIYVDGTLRTTATRNLEADNAAHVVTIGNMRDNNPFSGLIDELRYYSQALTAAQLVSDMNTPISPVVDSTAPVLSNGQPTGTLVAGTTQTNLALTTNENATCRYGTSGGVAFGGMPNTFGTTGGTAHSTLVTGLVSGQSYTYYLRCQDGAGNATTADFVISFTVAAPDSMVPTVALTAPSGAATVTGNVTVSANASDNVGVAGVQFLLDGSNLGSEVTALPYSVTWNTTTASNGTHILSARARDAAGNQATAASISVTVANTAPSGLGAAIGFNEGSGTTAADSSGGGHTATLVNGPTWVAGQYGMGVSFDGVNDSASVANSNTLNLGGGDFTIMAWVRRNALGGSAQRHILAKCATSAWAAGCKELYFAGDQLRFGSATTGDVNSISIADANWHHVAVTFTRSTNTVRIYVDGTLRTTATRNLEADNAAHVVTIGNMRGNNPFSGVIDELRVYSQALTAAQIVADMNSPL